MKVMLAYLARFIDSSGGAEKVCCNMANEMIKRGYEVSIVYCYGKSGRPVYPLHSQVRMYNLMEIHPGKWKGEMTPSFPKWRKIIREFLRIFSVGRAHGWQERYVGKLLQDEIRTVVQKEKPDIIISYWPKDSNYILNYAKINIPVITMFHFGPDILARDASKGSIKACRNSAFVQVLLKGDVDRLKKYIPKVNAVWIPNAVPQYKEQADLLKDKDNRTIINVARLDKTTKRQHILIAAFAEIADKFPEWNVEIWGEDWNKRYKKELEEKIFQFGLQNRIFLRGLTENIEEKYLQADIFAWPSSHEGFGLALAEAMSAGLPVVACSSCIASAELVSEQSGVLVSDSVHAFADGLADLMEDKEKRCKMGGVAKQKMKDFNDSAVWDRWEKLIHKQALQNNQKSWKDGTGSV